MHLSVRSKAVGTVAALAAAAGIAMAVTLPSAPHRTTTVNMPAAVSPAAAADVAERSALMSSLTDNGPGTRVNKVLVKRMTWGAFEKSGLNSNIHPQPVPNTQMVYVVIQSGIVKISMDPQKTYSWVVTVLSAQGAHQPIFQTAGGPEPVPSWFTAAPDIPAT